jgi:tetratricopeptide (TPR) repeat protein
MEERNNPSMLDSAIQYLDSSITCNPENVLPYSNKLVALFLKKDFSEAIDVLNSMSELSCKNPAKYDDMKAMAYEQLLQMDSANKYYSSALIYHKSQLKQFPDSAALNLSVSLMVLKVKGREAAVIQMSDFGKAHPDDPVVKMYEDAFMNVINNADATSYDMLFNVTR